jgi:hypothetical protein
VAGRRHEWQPDPARRVCRPRVPVLTGRRQARHCLPAQREARRVCKNPPGFCVSGPPPPPPPAPALASRLTAAAGRRAPPGGRRPGCWCC